MRVDKNGLIFITKREGLRLKVYLCSAGVPTIGVGHTGPNVYIGMNPISKELALLLLNQDLEWVNRAINRYVKAPLNQNQFNALASFVFNFGTPSFRSSTLLRKLNRGDYIGASNEFWKWRRAGGRIIRGLVIRRELEKQLFLS